MSPQPVGTRLHQSGKTTRRAERKGAYWGAKREARPGLAFDQRVRARRDRQRDHGNRNTTLELVRWQAAREPAPTRRVLPAEINERASST